MKSALRKSSLFVLLSFLLVLLTANATPVATTPESGTQSVTGTVQSVSDTSLVLSHTNEGKEVQTTFELRADTKVEGTLAKDAKATVEYRVEEGKNIAVRVTVGS